MHRIGKQESDVTLVAVTKNFPVDAVIAADLSGLTTVGENYVLEAASKRESFLEHIQAAGKDKSGLEWHLLGHLQSNKAKNAVEIFDVIQSVDSYKIASCLSSAAQNINKRQRILIQVRLGNEPTKYGIAADAAIELAHEAAQMPGLTLEGLMGIAPRGVDPRRYYHDLYQLFEKLPKTYRKTLSMGMSSDFITAIEEGSSMVRIGTAIFGSRSY